MITKAIVAKKLEEYLHHELSLTQLVDWAENAIMESDIAPSDTEVIAQVLGRIGVADVRAFGLTLDECEHLLERLGYSIRLDVVAV